MNLTNYQPKEPPLPINNIINDLFRNRFHKKMEIDKSDFVTLPMLPLNNLRKQYSQISQRSAFSDRDQEEDKILLQTKQTCPREIKRKLISKQQFFSKTLPTTKKLHKSYNNFLVNLMHKANLLLIKNKVPPNLSIHQTVDEGDFVLAQDGLSYQRKDYPHYSNAIKLHELPDNNRQSVFINQPQKIKQEQLYFQIEDNCVLKIKHIYHFVSILFKRSINFSKKNKLQRTNSNQPRQSENHDFEVIANQLQIHFRTSKLLYDILNEFYGFERQMIRGEQGKIKASKQIRSSLKLILQKYKVNEAVHIPHGQLYISLKELRQLLHQQMLQQDDQND